MTAGRVEEKSRITSIAISKSNLEIADDPTFDTMTRFWEFEPPDEAKLTQPISPKGKPAQIVVNRQRRYINMPIGLKIQDNFEYDLLQVEYPSEIAIANIHSVGTEYKESMVEIGDTIRFGEKSRRTFVKQLAAAASATTAINVAVKEAAGEAPDGVGLVQTFDENGHPDHVKIVSEERYRRIQAIKRINPDEFMNAHPFIDSFALKENSGNSELGLHLYLREENEPHPREVDEIPQNLLESQSVDVRSMPITTEVRPIEERRPNNYAYNCNDAQNTLEGGLLIGAKGENNRGTLTTCSQKNNNHMLIVARHVAQGADSFDSGESVKTIVHPSEDCTSSKDATDSAYWEDSTNDIVIYNIDTSNFSYTIGESVHPGVEDITGTWSWQGISDYTSSGNTIDCDGVGANSGHRFPTVHEANRTSEVYDNVKMDNDYFTDGDSGAPVVDDDVYSGKLVCMNVGSASSFWEGSWNFGPVGNQVAKDTTF